MNKKGAGHVEFIIAIVLFITVVGGGLLLLNPAKSNRTVESSLSYTFNEIEKYAGTQIEIYNVKITSSPGDVISIPISATVQENKEKVRIENILGDKIEPYGADSNNVYFDYTKVPADGKYFAVIKFNKQFNPGTLSSGASGVYELASSSKRTVISEAEMIKLKEAYNSGYENLRTDTFNLPGNDFAFSLIFADEDSGNINVGTEIPTGLDVFVDSKRIEVLRIDGSLTFAELIVTVW